MGRVSFLQNYGNWLLASFTGSPIITAKEAAKKYIDGIEKIIDGTQRYVVSNRLLFLDSGLNEFSVGPVKVVSGQKIVDELNGISETTGNWNAELGTPGVVGDGQKSTVKVYKNNWDMNIKAASENIYEEAAWLAGIIVSLLRICTRDTLGPFIVNENRPEPHPFRGCEYENTALIFDESGLHTGGMWVPTKYIITQRTVEYCQRKEFLDIVKNLFNSKKNTLAARVFQGLGWLARARQNDDKAEKFLYFFTAIEAVLSSNDKTAPVVQTIARNASCLLTNENNRRKDNSKLIKKLYSIRSCLIHAGDREVSSQDVRQLSTISELIFFNILDKIDLNTAYGDFHNELNDCSYGLDWRNNETHFIRAS